MIKGEFWVRGGLINVGRSKLNDMCRIMVALIIL